MARDNGLPFRFGTIIYPLWRKQYPKWVRPFTDYFWQNQRMPVAIDEHPPQQPKRLAQYLADYEILPTIDDVHALEQAIITSRARIITPDLHQTPAVYEGNPVRIPAQWETMEKVLISWAILYPKIWEMHAQMVEAISAVATVEILVPSELWAKAVWVYLQERGKAALSKVQFIIIPTNDIWIRDYGPIMAWGDGGQRVALDSIYDVLPAYPQADDDGMTARWAAHYELPVFKMNLHTEGGNLWTDGEGTLIMSEQILYSNRYYTRETLLEYLHSFLDFEVLHILPRLTLEETGHIDLLVKLASADTVLVSSADKSISTWKALRKAKRYFERSTNARGQSYRILELPTPPLYLNWGTYTIRRAYTNSLTINKRVLVPTYGLETDDIALGIYAEAMPSYEIIPIDCEVAINGGGAVHCMTKEIPAISD